MPYPDGLDTRRIPDGDRPEVARRKLDAMERVLRSKVQSLLDAVELIREPGAWVFARGTNGQDLVLSILTDTTAYCTDLIAEIDAIPEKEARAEEERLAELQKWGKR